MSEHGDISDSEATLSGATVGDGFSIAGTMLGDTGEVTEDGEGWGTAAVIEPGQRLGPYELVRHIGAGGMGEVFSARHVDSGKLVAIKFLSRTTARLLYRFKREFRAMADVDHRNVVSLGELVVPPTGAAFFTMELIDGQPFSDYVRRRSRKGELPNLVRLGRALRQLVRGLTHLHDVGIVHRDIKPSNVLVTREGRVVILDFGLVSELDEDAGESGISGDGQLLGTPAYMAPEQAALQAVTPATDFYAVGVLVYECLTGVLPYRGSALEIVLRKQEEDPPDPSDIVAGVPPVLRDVCLRLLTHAPERRPDAEDLLAALASRKLGAGEQSRPHAAASKRRERRSELPFVGRRAELRALHEALDDVRIRRSAVVVHVSGESGLGKSALVGRFLGEARATTNAMILRGRCLERESVPYKGVDSVVDSLFTRLGRMLDDDVRRLRPRHVGPLMQIFPVLGDVWPLERSHVERWEPSERRRLGLAALRELLTRLADDRPLVIHVDDFQWADVDGARLLGALLVPPDPPAILLIASFRESLLDGVEQREALRELTSPEFRLGVDVRELRLGRLSDHAAAELAIALMQLDDSGDSIGEREEIQRRADELARRANGNPFYIGQMVLHDAGEDAGVGDDRVVARRIVSLSPAARRLLATVAVSGGPTPLAVVRDVYAHSTRGPESSWAGQLSAIGEVIEQLCELGLLTRRGGEIDSSHDGVARDPSASGSFGEAVLEAAHGRIREVTIGELETGELEEIHHELGCALERLGGEPEALAEHFERSGELRRALDYAERAAAQAVENLAFGRAVELYRRGLTLLERIASESSPDAEPAAERDRARRRGLRLKLAEQLVNFGRSSEAGRLLRELAENAASPREALVLRRNAAEQLLGAGHVGEGLALSATVLREIGEAPPRGFWLTMLLFMLGRLRLWLRGTRFELRREDEVPREQLEHIDTLMTINRGLILHLELHSWILHNRLMILTLDAGEPRRLSRMFANEMLVISTFGGEGEVHELAGQARELAAKVEDPELDRTIDLQRDMVEYALNRFRKATDQLCELLPRLEDVPGADVLRLSSVLIYSSLCVITGRWAELYRNLPQWLAAARERGNLREIVELEAYAAMTELHRGNPGQARYHFDNGRELWDASSYNYTSVMLDRVEIFLCLGEGEYDDVCARIDTMLADVERSSVALNPVVKRFVDQLIGRCWAVAAVNCSGDTKLLGRVRKACRRLRRTKVGLYVGEAALFDAALCSIAGDAPSMRRHWREAELLFDQHGIESQLAAVRWQLGKVTDGEESRRFTRAAAKYFEHSGIADPDRIAAMLAPRSLPR